jgi:uncharacterized membrane protein affecting hemolysin expression
MPQLMAKMRIQRKLMASVMLTSGAVLLVTCSAFFAYEFLTFRQTSVRQLSTLGRIVGNNSTASLAFDNQEDATEVLGALRANPHIVAAALYDSDGALFAKFPATIPVAALPTAPASDGYRFKGAHFAIFQPVVQDERRLGTLYLQ